MRIRKYWHELYLTVMVTLSLSVISASALLLRGLPGLGMTAVGVFVSVLGVGLYDQWRDAELAKARVKTRRR